MTRRQPRTLPADGRPVVPDPPLHPRRDEVVGYQLHVQLRDIEPPIWRRFVVPSDLGLDELHRVLQVVMGWQNSHLHGFSRGPDFFIAPPGDRFVMDGDDEGLGGVLEGDVRVDEVLAETGDTLTYAYDFGDGWEHTVRLEEIVDPPGADAARPAVVLDGARACPPEDSGGVPGYLEAQESARTLAAGGTLEEWPAERHAIMYGDMTPDEALRSFETFDVGARQALLEEIPGGGLSPDVMTLLDRAEPPDAVFELISDASGTDVPQLTPDEVRAAVGHFTWFLDRVGSDGLTLTSAGYLRPADVEAVAERLGLSREWYGKLNRENHAPQVTYFREAVQALGLVRKAKKQLTLTALGRRLLDRDPQALWDHLVERLPLVPRGKNEKPGREASLLVLLRAAGSGDGIAVDGPGEWTREPDPLLADAFASLGWSYDDRRMSSRDVHRAAWLTDVVLTRVGGYEPVPGAWEWSMRPTAVGRALAHAALRR